MLAESYFGLNDEPVLNTSGYHRAEKEYLDPSNYKQKIAVVRSVIAESYYDTEQRRVINRAGYDRVNRVTNDFKQTALTEYYLNGSPVNIDKGYAILTREFDENGLVTGESYFGESEEPVRCSDGYHKSVRIWQDGHAVSEAWFDTDGMPVALNDTYVKIEREFDKEGKMTAERYYGPDNEMIPCNGGYDEIRIVDGEEVFYLNGAIYTPPAESEPEEKFEEKDAV